MAAFLDTIAGDVRSVVEKRKRTVPLAALEQRALFREPTRGFARALSGGRRKIIAEVKRASPSKGLIRADFDAVAIARDYAAHGAAAISVLTEERHFQGSLDYLERIRGAVAVPLLRKDFIIDPYQIVEARGFGADAVLLIAALLEVGAMRELREQATALGLDTLVEVHAEAELDAAVAAGAQIVGINNRDLRTFHVDLETTRRLASKVPTGLPAVCESGIDSVEQIRRVEEWGLHAFLIGESLMRAPAPGKKLFELLGDDEAFRGAASRQG